MGEKFALWTRWDINVYLQSVRKLNQTFSYFFPSSDGKQGKGSENLTGDYLQITFERIKRRNKIKWNMGK